MTHEAGWMATLHDFQNYTLPWEEFRKIPFAEFAEQYVIGEFHEILANSPNRGAFEQKFKLYGVAMEVLQARYGFFSKLVTGDAGLLARHQSAVGTGDLEKRLLFALHFVFVRAARILRTYNDMLGNYPEYLKNLASLAIPKDGGCHTVQVCVCDGAKEPYTASCLPHDTTVLLPFKAQAPKLATQADIDKLFG